MEEKATPSALTEEDRQIILIIRELRRQLSLDELDISANTVSWTDRFALRKAPPEYIRFWLGDVRLPVVLKGKLSPEEWRPLLASGLIYFRIVGKKTLRYLGELVILPFLVIGIGSALILEASGSGLGPSQIFGLSLGLMLATALIGAFLLGRKLAWIRLKADQEASRLVGRDQLRRSLEKVDQIVGRVASVQTILRFKPSLAERIRNLE